MSSFSRSRRELPLFCHNCLWLPAHWMLARVFVTWPWELQIPRERERKGGRAIGHFANFAPRRCQVLSPRLFAHHIRNLLAALLLLIAVERKSLPRSRTWFRFLSRGHAPTWWIHFAACAGRRRRGGGDKCT